MRTQLHPQITELEAQLARDRAALGIHSPSCHVATQQAPAVATRGRTAASGGREVPAVRQPRARSPTAATPPPAGARAGPVSPAAPAAPAPKRQRSNKLQAGAGGMQPSAADTRSTPTTSRSGTPARSTRSSGRQQASGKRPPGESVGGNDGQGGGGVMGRGKRAR